jgi:hypothetical protein
MPSFLSSFLPIGLMGLLIAAMLAADMSTNSSYMLSWGSVIYNDILAPFRRTAWSDQRAILWNRCIVALIGLYLLVFGLFYQIEGNVWSYLLETGEQLGCHRRHPARCRGAGGTSHLGKTTRHSRLGREHRQRHRWHRRLRRCRSGNDRRFAAQTPLPLRMTTFWLLLTLAALLWYGSVTIYVSIKGASDIREMLARLKRRDRND